MLAQNKQLPIKVLHILHDARWSGLPAQAFHVFTNLDPQKISASVLFADEGVYTHLSREKGIPITVFAKRRPFLWRFNRFLFNLKLPGLLKYVDVVHIHSYLLAPTVLFAKWLGACVVFHIVESPRRVGPLLKWALAVADCVVYCGEGNADHFSAHTTRRQKTIPNAIPTHVVAPHREIHNPPNIIQMATIHYGKGQDLLIRAFEKLKNQKAQLFIYGSVGLTKRKFFRSLKDFANDHGLNQRVFFPGVAPDSRKVFAQASIWVHPSRSEGLPLVLLEAMDNALPVITHDACGMKDIVVDGETGYLVPVGDVDLLAERIDRLLSDPELRRKMGEAGRQRVLNVFDARKRAKDYEALYAELVDEKAKQ